MCCEVYKGSGPAQLPLVLGGHSFIEQLGNDPAPSPEGAAELVERCLDAGITWFDTTYQPERVALGAALARLGRRPEAHLIAWNFFEAFGPGDEVGDAAAYEAHSLDQICEELGTDRVELLVVHPVEDAAAQRRQEELAGTWLAEGRVGELGLWAFSATELRTVRRDVPYAWIVAPFNAADRAAADVFPAARGRGARGIATSPFGRGWDLERLVAAASTQGGSSTADAAAEVADLMLRFSLFESSADRLVVSMRRPRWIPANVASVERGPLNATERERLTNLISS
ncbi:MAG TPA: aldo/keto reductase [Solirubrobacterales bacterium]|nr:aldo/keto reductase [Solirubrobacterales bacterium]